jgi:aminoglycoside 6'-N-acetyltransferase I
MVDIHPVRPHEVSAWIDMRHALWPDATREELEREVAEILDSDEQEVAFIATGEDGQPIGFVEASIKDWNWAPGISTRPFGYVEGWYVAPEARRTGLGRALIDVAENWARSHGCTEMGSDAELDNITSLVAHVRLGYEVAEQLVHFSKKL